MLDSKPDGYVYAAVALLPNGKIFVSGGADFTGGGTKNTYLFDPNAASGSQWVAQDEAQMLATAGKQRCFQTVEFWFLET